MGLTITLPDQLKEFVETQAAKGGYRSASDYVKSLVEEAEKAAFRAAIDAKLKAAIESLERGEGREMTPADWERLRDKIRSRIPKRQGRRR